MATYYYTDRYRTSRSSVVEEVYYDNRSNFLYVALLSGRKFRYDNVPAYVFEKFKQKDPWDNSPPSAGAIWNRHVKGVYVSRELSRYDTQFSEVPVTKASRVTAPGAYARSIVTAPAKSEFTVKVEVNGTLTIKGEAENVTDALAKVAEVLAETFSGTHKVKELSQKFD